MKRTLILALSLACGLPCMADSTQHFLRKLGSIAQQDGTNQVSVTATKDADKKPSVSVSFRVGDSTSSDTLSNLESGWFAFIEDTTRIWVFDGSALRLVHYTDKSLTDSSSPEVDKRCPKEVRDALPESYRSKHIP